MPVTSAISASFSARNSAARASARLLAPSMRQLYAASVARRVGSGGTRRHDTARLGAQVDEHRRTAREVEDHDPGVPQRWSARCAGWAQATPAELLMDDRWVRRGERGERGGERRAAGQARCRLELPGVADDLWRHK